MTLVSEGPDAHYSGMVPGWIEGLYAADDLAVPLARFAARVGARYLDARVTGADEAVLHTEAGEVPYDILVLNLGAGVAPLPGPVAAVPAKPFRALFAGLDGRLTSAKTFAIVGAGAAGVEVALALARRRPDAAIALIESGPLILAPFPETFRRRVASHLAAAGVAVRTGVPVREIGADAVVLADGTIVPSEATLAFTGAAPPAALSAMPFARAPDGFLATDAALRSLSHPNVLAVGDVATHAADPRPKAGVFAVRSGWPLAAAVRALLAGETPPPVHLQRHALVLLSTGGRHAIGTRNGLAMEGRAVWWLKDRIDRRFMARLNAPPDA